jgi:ankyrin repeat protein
MGASLEGINDNYAYPYEIAAYKIPHPGLLEYFLNKGIDVKRSGRDALLSASKNSLENVKFLIGLGHSIDVTNTRGQTPLDIAILYHQKNVIEFLISKDAPFNYEKAIEKISSPELLNLIK